MVRLWKHLQQSVHSCTVWVKETVSPSGTSFGTNHRCCCCCWNELFESILLCLCSYPLMCLYRNHQELTLSYLSRIQLHILWTQFLFLFPNSLNTSEKALVKCIRIIKILLLKAIILSLSAGEFICSQQL